MALRKHEQIAVVIGDGAFRYHVTDGDTLKRREPAPRQPELFSNTESTRYIRRFDNSRPVAPPPTCVRPKRPGSVR